MNTAAKNNFENLFSIVTVFCVFIMVGSFFTLAKQYPPKFVVLERAKQETKVQGYSRPGMSKADNAQGSVQDSKEVKTIDLLASLSKEDQMQLQQRFDQAASLLHAGQFEYAITALEQVVKIQPRMPEAHVNLGYAYLGLKDYQTSVIAFSYAIDLRPEQLNAYYGLAEALEGMEDYEGALGAMRSYIHLSSPNDPFMQKAQSAIWELETKLGRKPSVEEQDKSMQFDSGRFVSPHGSPPQQ